MRYCHCTSVRRTWWLIPARNIYLNCMGSAYEIPPESRWPPREVGLGRHLVTWGGVRSHATWRNVGENSSPASKGCAGVSRYYAERVRECSRTPYSDVSPYSVCRSHALLVRFRKRVGELRSSILSVLFEAAGGSHRQAQLTIRVYTRPVDLCHRTEWVRNTTGSYAF